MPGHARIEGDELRRLADAKPDEIGHPPDLDVRRPQHRRDRFEGRSQVRALRLEHTLRSPHADHLLFRVPPLGRERRAEVLAPRVRGASARCDTPPRRRRTRRRSHAHGVRRGTRDSYAQSGLFGFFVETRLDDPCGFGLLVEQRSCIRVHAAPVLECLGKAA